MIDGAELSQLAERRRIAAAIREACIQAAIDGYERASTDGLCGAGAWECAIESMRALDLESLVRETARTK